MNDDTELGNGAEGAETAQPELSPEQPAATRSQDPLAQSDDLPDFGNFGAESERPIHGAQFDPDLKMILDIPVSLSMEVGNTQIPIRDLLQLGQGSVVELDRLAGEPLDVLVNGTLIAHGEFVVINDKFGIRMTDVISPTERIKKLT